MNRFQASSSVGNDRAQQPTSGSSVRDSSRVIPRVSQELPVVISSLLVKFPHLKQITDKYSLTPFKILSVPMLETLDREIMAYPDIVNEGCSFLEIVDQVSIFYTEPSSQTYLDEVLRRLFSHRISREGYDGDSSLVPSVMSEYFMTGSTEHFLKDNPFIFGLYLFVLFHSITQFSEGQ